MPGSHSDDSVAEVTVTEAAKGHLAAQLELVSGRDTCFRLRTGSDQKMSTTVTKPSPGDTLVRHGSSLTAPSQQSCNKATHRWTTSPFFAPTVEKKQRRASPLGATYIDMCCTRVQY